MGQFWGSARLETRNSKFESHPNYQIRILDFGFDSKFEFRISSFFSRIFYDFFDGCITVKNAAQAVFPQSHHPELDGFLTHDDCRGALVNQASDGIVHNEQLENAFPASITRVIAVGAAAAIIEDLVTEIVRRKIQHAQLVFG